MHPNKVIANEKKQQISSSKDALPISNKRHFIGRLLSDLLAVLTLESCVDRGQRTQPYLLPNRGRVLMGHCACT